MKNFILPVLALLFALSYAGAEVIDSVMYNPARLGQYEKLKVSDKASFKGGVKANTLTLQSAGTVSISNAGDYQVSNTDVKGSVNMPSTHFVAPTIKAQGGTARFVQTGETSEINTINSVLPRLKANILKMNAVTVNGSSTTDYDGDNIKGLRLGGNDIPAPSVNCSGLNWFARVDRNSGQTYQVLGLGTCEGGEEPEQEEKDEAFCKMHLAEYLEECCVVLEQAGYHPPLCSACQPSYGEWITDYYAKGAAQAPVDTCNGVTSSAYVCENAEKTCKDIEGLNSSPKDNTVISASGGISCSDFSSAYSALYGRQPYGSCSSKVTIEFLRKEYFVYDYNCSADQCYSARYGGTGDYVGCYAGQSTITKVIMCSPALQYRYRDVACCYAY